MPETCSVCSKPILPGEPRYTAHEPEKFMHFDCANVPPSESKQLSGLKSCRKRPGEGQMAERVAELLTEALTAHLGKPTQVYPDMLWVQNNAFGKKWDLARWGAQVGHLHISSWSRMRDCVRNGIYLHNDRGMLHADAK